MVDKERSQQQERHYRELMTGRRYEQAAELAMASGLGMAKHEDAAINALSEKLKRGSIRDVNTAYAFAKYHRLSDQAIERPVRAAAQYRLQKGDTEVFDRISESFGLKRDARNEIIGNAFVHCLETGRLERAALIKGKYPTEIPKNERDFALDAFGILLSAGKFKAAQNTSEHYGFNYNEELSLARGAYELCMQEQQPDRAKAIKSIYPRAAE